MGFEKKIARVFIYIYAVLCFCQAKTLKIPIGKYNVAFIYFIYIIFAFLLMIFVFRNQYKYKINDSYTKFITTMLVWQLFNLPFGLINGIEGWLLLTRLVVIFFVSGYMLKVYVTSMEMLKKVFLLSYLGMMLQMFLGVFEHVTGIYFWTSTKELFESHPFFMAKKYPCAMQENPNDFACLMFFLIGMSYVYFKISKKTIMKVIAILVAGVSGYLIVASDSRGILLGIVVTVAHYVLSNAVGKVKKKRILQSCICIIIVFVFCIYRIEWFTHFFASKLDFDMSYGSEARRVELWTLALNEFVRTVGVGTGFHVGNTHCFWIEILSESGLVVFVLLIGFLLDLYKKLTLVISKKYIKETLLISAKVMRSVLIGMLIVLISPASVLNIYWIGFVFGIMAVFGSLVTKQMLEGQ